MPAMVCQTGQNKPTFAVLPHLALFRQEKLIVPAPNMALFGKIWPLLKNILLATLKVTNKFVFCIRCETFLNIFGELNIFCENNT
jgi:hypothetical protein